MKRSSVAIGFALVTLCLVVLLVTRPALHVERNARIAVPAATLYERVVDFDRWPGWAPWREIVAHCSPSRGVGARCTTPMAELAIVRAEPPTLVQYEIRFPRATDDTGTLSIRLEPDGDETDVTFALDASSDLADRGFGVFRNVAGRFGREFDQALHALAQPEPSTPPDPALPPS